MLWLPCAVRVSWIDRPHGRSRNINHTNSTSLSFIIRSDTDTWTKKSSKPENTFFLTFTSGRLFGQMNLTSEFSAAWYYAWKVKVLYCSTAKVKVGEPINNDVRQRVLNNFYPTWPTWSFSRTKRVSFFLLILHQMCHESKRSRLIHEIRQFFLARVEMSHLA